MLDNIPPRDGLAYGTTEDIITSVQNLINTLDNKSRIIASYGGSMPPDVSTEKINIFINAVKKFDTV